MTASVDELSTAEILRMAAAAETARVYGQLCPEFIHNCVHSSVWPMGNDREQLPETRNPLRHKENPRVAACPEGSMNSAAAPIGVDAPGTATNPRVTGGFPISTPLPSDTFSQARRVGSGGSG